MSLWLTIPLFCLHFKGVPVMAIKNKMILDGLDPSLLEWVYFYFFHIQLLILLLVVCDALLVTLLMHESHLSKCVKNKFVCVNCEFTPNRSTCCVHTAVHDAGHSNSSACEQHKLSPQIAIYAKLWSICLTEINLRNVINNCLRRNALKQFK